MYKMFKERRPPVNPEASGGKHTTYHNHVLSKIMPGDGPFYHHQLI